jgi:selenoprotein W-related protein
LTGRLLTAYKAKIASLKLIPASGGCFEFSVDNELIYSKLLTGQFPNEADLLTIVGDKLKK